MIALVSLKNSGYSFACMFSTALSHLQVHACAADDFENTMAKEEIAHDDLFNPIQEEYANT